MTTPDLIEAEVSIDALQNAIRDEDVVRSRPIATVKSFGSALAQNVLLGTGGTSHSQRHPCDAVYRP